ncbi:MAG: hypothetical protein FJY99_02745 [Candidatus Sericytochromatia bacterium]|nr:hypothetical protein [Candidatus Tanganyikabacteria bacterium]
MFARRTLALGSAALAMALVPACEALVPARLLATAPPGASPSTGEAPVSPTPGIATTPTAAPTALPTAVPTTLPTVVPTPVSSPPFVESYPEGKFATGIRVRLGAGPDAPYFDGTTPLELGVAPVVGSTPLRPHTLRLVPEIRLNDQSTDARARFTIEVDGDVELDEVEPGLFEADDETGTARIIVESLDGRMKMTLPVSIVDESAMDVVVE